MHAEEEEEEENKIGKEKNERRRGEEGSRVEISLQEGREMNWKNKLERVAGVADLCEWSESW